MTILAHPEPIAQDPYGPGTPWSTHDWGMDAFWGDSCWFCAACDTSSIKDAAHRQCPRQVVELNTMSRAALVKPRENV